MEIPKSDIPWLTVHRGSNYNQFIELSSVPTKQFGGTATQWFGYRMPSNRSHRLHLILATHSLSIKTSVQSATNSQCFLAVLQISGSANERGYMHQVSMSGDQLIEFVSRPSGREIVHTVSVCIEEVFCKLEPWCRSKEQTDKAKVILNVSVGRYFTSLSVVLRIMQRHISIQNRSHREFAPAFYLFEQWYQSKENNLNRGKQFTSSVQHRVSILQVRTMCGIYPMPSVIDIFHTGFSTYLL